MEKKICSCCKQEKEANQYSTDIHRKDGLRVYCKDCDRQKWRECKARNPERFREVVNRAARRRRAANPEKYREYHKLQRRKYNRTPAGKYWNKRCIAKNSGDAFNITQQDFVSWFEKQGLKCHYCGVELDFVAGRGSDTKLRGLSIDRKDNAVGYELRNMCLACRRCNTIKGSWFTEKEMIEIARNYLCTKSFT